MSAKQGTSKLKGLDAHESKSVLTELLKRHPELRMEAKGIVMELFGDVNEQDIAESIASLVSNLRFDDLNRRAGRHAGGYLSPTDAAWEILAESITEVRDDMIRRFDAGLKLAAEKTCLGIILGLYRSDEADHDGLLGWAEDFTAEAAAHSFEALLVRYPPSRREAAGNRILRLAEEEAADWSTMLKRVLHSAMLKKKRKRK